MSTTEQTLLKEGEELDKPFTYFKYRGNVKKESGIKKEPGSDFSLSNISSVFNKNKIHPMGGRKSRIGRKKRANKRTMKRRR